MMKQVMKRAWELAKMGVKKFGGKVREYLAASLSIAWKEVKNMGEKLAELVGTEKQVKWATSIRKDFIKAQQKFNEAVINFLESEIHEYTGDAEIVEKIQKDIEVVKPFIKKMADYFTQETSAKVYIDRYANYKRFTRSVTIPMRDYVLDAIDKKEVKKTLAIKNGIEALEKFYIK